MFAKRRDPKYEQHMRPEEIAAFASQQVSQEESRMFIAHLSDCSLCRKLVSKVVASEKTVPDPDLPVG